MLTMGRRTLKLAFGTTALALLALAIGIIALFPTYSLELSEDRIYQEIQQRLPVTVKGVTVDEVEFDLTTDGIWIKAPAETERLGVRASAMFETTINPDVRNMGVYLDPNYIETTDVRINEQTVSEATTAAAHSLQDRANTAITRGLDLLRRSTTGIDLEGGITPQITIDETWLEEKALEFEARFTEAAGNVMSRILTDVPVYRLQGALGFVISASFDGYDLYDDRIVIHLSLIRLSWAVLGILACIFISGLVVVAMLRNPQAFGGFIRIAEVGTVGLGILSD